MASYRSTSYPDVLQQPPHRNDWKQQRICVCRALHLKPRMLELLFHFFQLNRRSVPISSSCDDRSHSHAGSLSNKLPTRFQSSIQLAQRAIDVGNSSITSNEYAASKISTGKESR
jgi:hypothetical protein